MLGRLIRGVPVLYSAAAGVAGLCILFQMLSVVYMVVMRYIVHRAPGPFVDINSLFMVPVAYMGLAYCVVKRGHPVVLLLVKLLPPRWQWWSEILSYVSGLFVGLLLAWPLTDKAWSAFQGGYSSITSNWPLWPFLALSAIGACLFFVAMLQELVRLVLGWDLPREEEEASKIRL